jgi:hypothetical protein
VPPLELAYEVKKQFCGGLKEKIQGGIRPQAASLRDGGYTARMVAGERPMDDDALILIPGLGLVCPECSVVVQCEYSRSYLREKALVDGEVEVIHHCDTARERMDFHMNTVKLNTTQLDKIRDVLSKG